MSVKIKKRNENEYIYFQKRDGKVIFLGKDGEVSRYPDRVVKALDTLLNKDSSHFENEKKLISILPPSKQSDYVSRIVKKIEKEQDELMSFSSAAKKFKPKS